MSNQYPFNVFSHYLQNLQLLLNKISVHVNGDAQFLTSRIAPDMLPFIQQVRATANFSLRGCCPWVGQAVVLFNQRDESFSGLQQQITETLAKLNELSALQVKPPAYIQEEAGFATVKLPPTEFIQQYCLPNFFFHLSLVYAIARKEGVPLTKGDFDGFHHYAPGFSFEQ